MMHLYISLLPLLFTFVDAQTKICIWGSTDHMSSGTADYDRYNGEYIKQSTTYNEYPWWKQSPGNANCATTSQAMVYTAKYGIDSHWQVSTSKTLNWIHIQPNCETANLANPTLCSTNWWVWHTANTWDGDQLSWSVTAGSCPTLTCRRIQVLNSGNTACDQIFMKDYSQEYVWKYSNLYLYFNIYTFKWYCSTTNGHLDCGVDSSITHQKWSSSSDGWKSANMGESFTVSLSTGRTSTFMCLDTLSPTTQRPTFSPARHPTFSPTFSPTLAPAISPTRKPTKCPTSTPTKAPTGSPSQPPTKAPTLAPHYSPTGSPTQPPTKAPTDSPSAITQSPTDTPTFSPTVAPTHAPTITWSLCKPAMECVYIVQVIFTVDWEAADTFGSDLAHKIWIQRQLEELVRVELDKYVDLANTLIVVTMNSPIVVDCMIGSNEKKAIDTLLYNAQGSDDMEMFIGITLTQETQQQYNNSAFNVEHITIETKQIKPEDGSNSNPGNNPGNSNESEDAIIIGIIVIGSLLLLCALCSICLCCKVTKSVKDVNESRRTNTMQFYTGARSTSNVIGDCSGDEEENWL